MSTNGHFNALGVKRLDREGSPLSHRTDNVNEVSVEEGTSGAQTPSLHLLGQQQSCRTHKDKERERKSGLCSLAPLMTINRGPTMYKSDVLLSRNNSDQGPVFCEALTPFLPATEPLFDLAEIGPSQEPYHKREVLPFQVRAILQPALAVSVPLYTSVDHSESLSELTLTCSHCS
ncbi:unnamed protein product [Leuciscus chuanchicus]